MIYHIHDDALDTPAAYRADTAADAWAQHAARFADAGWSDRVRIGVSTDGEEPEQRTFRADGRGGWVDG